jgi:hypothetical protein
LIKRTASRALVVALASALALSGAAMAKNPNHGNGGTHGSPVGHADKAGATGLKTKGNASHPGGVFRVLAVVKAAPADRPATVNAIVHFASGDVPAVLTRSGNGAAYHANLPVPASEPAGTVLIDATALVAGATLTATGSGKIVIGDTAEAPAAPETPDAVEAPNTCTSPTPDNSLEASDAPESPEASDAPESPEASDAPEASEAPEASDAPDADASQNADETSDTCDQGGIVISAEMMAKIIAFMESLVD